MVMLSEFLRFDLADGRRQARLVDLAIDLAVGDYPPITRLFLRGSEKQQVELGWSAVETIDWGRRQIRVADLESVTPAPLEIWKQTVLLKRDLLDALVLDLANRNATLVNDLWLHEEDGQLLVRGADISPWAVVRRLSRGLFGHGTNRHLLDWKDVEFLRGDPQAARRGGDYHRRVTRLLPAEIARLMEAIPYLHAAELLALIPDAVAADVLEVMQPERQLQVFEELDTPSAVRVLALMSPDAAADLVGRLPPNLAQHCLEELPQPQSRRLIELLRYPADMAGGIMTNDMIVVPAALTIAKAREEVRDQLADPDFAYYLYVVDDMEARQLQGVVTMRDLLVADEARRLEEVMCQQLVTIDPLEPATEAAWRVVDTSLAALPVVARDRRLIGAITADAAVAQIAPRIWSRQAPRVFS